MEMHLKNKKANKKNVVWGLSSLGWGFNTTAIFQGKDFSRSKQSFG